MDLVWMGLVATVPISVGAAASAFSMRWISQSAIEGMTRQPDISAQLFTAMLIGMALVEALCIYCLVIALMLANTVTG